MKTIFTSLLLASFTVLKAQNSVLIKPNVSQAFNCVVASPFPTTTSSSNPVNLVAAYWTASGSPGAWRSFFKFDLTVIPNGAIIDSAYFSFYSDNSSTYGSTGSPNYGVDNSAYICRNTTPFNSNNILWSGQPLYTLVNAVELVQSSSTSQNYIHLNATELLKDILNTVNNGFALVLKNELSTYNSQIFCSSSHTDSSKHPSLLIYYHELFPQSSSNILEQNEFNLTQLSSKIQINFLESFQGKAELIDINGSIIQSISGNNSRTIEFSKNNLKKGIYFIKIWNDGHSTVMKTMI